MFLKGQWQQVADCSKTVMYLFIYSTARTLTTKTATFESQSSSVLKVYLVMWVRSWCLDWVGVDVFFLLFRLFHAWSFCEEEYSSYSCFSFRFIYLFIYFTIRTQSRTVVMFFIEENFFSQQVKRWTFQAVIKTLLRLLSKLVVVLVLKLFFGSWPSSGSLPVWMPTIQTIQRIKERKCHSRGRRGVYVEQRGSIAGQGSVFLVFHIQVPLVPLTMAVPLNAP